MWVLSVRRGLEHHSSWDRILWGEGGADLGSFSGKKSASVSQVTKGCVRAVNRKQQGKSQVIQRGEMKWEDINDLGGVSNFQCIGVVFSPSRGQFLWCTGHVRLSSSVCWVPHLLLKAESGPLGSIYLFWVRIWMPSSPAVHWQFRGIRCWLLL